jgi:hypothetical protein
MSFTLNEETFLIYAIKNYDNPSCAGMKEFLDDLNSFRYLKRLFKKYQAGKELKERLILNHIIVLYNLFGVSATTQMLFYKIEKEHWTILKTFLIYLNYIDSETRLLNGDDLKAIPLDFTIVKKLRQI